MTANRWKDLNDLAIALIGLFVLPEKPDAIQ